MDLSIEKKKVLSEDKKTERFEIETILLFPTSRKKAPKLHEKDLRTISRIKKCINVKVMGGFDFIKGKSYLILYFYKNKEMITKRTLRIEPKTKNGVIKRISHFFEKPLTVQIKRSLVPPFKAQGIKLSLRSI